MMTNSKISVEPVPSQLAKFKIGQIVKHNRHNFPPGKISEVRWFPGVQGAHTKGFYAYLVDTFPKGFWVGDRDIVEVQDEI